MIVSILRWSEETSSLWSVRSRRIEGHPASASCSCIVVADTQNERDLEDKRYNMIDDEIAKTSDVRKRYERELDLLGVLNETKQFEKLDKQKFQKENK